MRGLGASQGAREMRGRVKKRSKKKVKRSKKCARVLETSPTPSAARPHFFKTSEWLNYSLDDKSFSRSFPQ